jgi:hypothetical protein
MFSYEVLDSLSLIDTFHISPVVNAKKTACMGPVVRKAFKSPTTVQLAIRWIKFKCLMICVAQSPFSTSVQRLKFGYPADKLEVCGQNNEYFG